MLRFSDLPHQRQHFIYEKVFSLRKEGLSYKQTIKRIVEDYNVKLALSTLSYWFNNDVKMLGGENQFEAKPSQELSYVLGVLFGDGSLSINKRKQEYRIRLETIDRDFAEKFSASVAGLLHKEKPFAVCKTTRGMYSTQIRSKQLYYFAKGLKEDFEKAKQFIEKCPLEFIQGLADSEGCTSISARITLKVRVIAAVSTNLQLLQHMKSILLSFNIASNLYLSHEAGITDSVIGKRKITRTKNLYTLSINKFSKNNS